jgi:hypothetical protein
MNFNISPESITYEDITTYLDETKTQLGIYMREVDHNHNINTPQFQIIKRKQQFATTIIIQYLITSYENKDLQYIRDKFNYINNIINYYNNIIDSRNNELKFRMNRLIEEIRRDRHSNNIDNILLTVDMYNELQ